MVLLNDMGFLKVKIIVPTIVTGILILTFLYFWNPQDISWFPRCPFLVLTGYQCPGCGTLRAIHSLLHFNFKNALYLNWLTVISIPVLVSLIFSRRLRFSVVFVRIILAVIMAWWVIRNFI